MKICILLNKVYFIGLCIDLFIFIIYYVGYCEQYKMF